MAVESSKEFARISNIYDRGRSAENVEFWAEEAERLVGLHEGSLVMDLGCGTGIYGLGIMERSSSVVFGFDPVPDMLGKARDKAPGFPVLRAVAEKIPARSGVLDLIYASQVWHHIAGRQEAADECARVLRRGGCMIVRTISHDQLKGKTVFKYFPEILPNQLRAYPSDDEFRAYFRKAGFSSTEILPYNMERFQTAGELIEVAEKRLWSMFRPITRQGLAKGVAELRRWDEEHGGAPVRNDETITLVVGRK
jgi:ubiquinone/menaquinone biosynthesis C-methylase UbiE